MERLQWLEERRRGIGGSDVAAILGLSPWKSPYRVYQEKRKEVEDWNGNEATDWGKRMEPAIRQWYSDKTGLEVRLPDGIIFNEKYPFMLASIDGFTEGPRGVEIKTARSGKGWGEPGTNEIPDYYTLQVQHYMAVTGLPVFDVPVSIAGGPPCLYEVPADKELIEILIEAEAKFWQRVVDGNPPEPVNYADAVQRFGKSTSTGSVMANDLIVSLIERLRTTREKMDELKATEETIKSGIISYLGDNGDCLITPSGETLCTYKLAKGRKTFDAKTFEKDHPDLYSQYLKNGEPSRRFLLK
jgi:putative phage-type endonuclease